MFETALFVVGLSFSIMSLETASIFDNVRTNELDRQMSDDSQVSNLSVSVTSSKKKFSIVWRKMSTLATIPTSYKDCLDDLYPMDDYRIQPAETWKIDTGIGYKNMPRNIVAILYGRSGYATQGLRVFHGVLDYNYEGKIMVMVTNEGNEDIILSPKKAFAQIMFQKRVTREGDEDNSRGTNGFGSSDVPLIQSEESLPNESVLLYKTNRINIYNPTSSPEILPRMNRRQPIRSNRIVRSPNFFASSHQTEPL
jgi:dUTPase